MRSSAEDVRMTYVPAVDMRMTYMPADDVQMTYLPVDDVWMMFWMTHPPAKSPMKSHSRVIRTSSALQFSDNFQSKSRQLC